MYTQVVAADIGRYEAKLYSGGEMVLFPSQVGEWQKREITSGGDFEVEVDGEKHFVGDLAERESFFRRRTVEANKANHDAATKLLTGLYLLTEEGEEVYLVSAVPINQYNAENRSRMRELLKGVHQVKVNDGAMKEILIDHVDITWEGAGVYLDLVMDDKVDGRAEYPWLKQKNVHLVDIGSRTCNLLTLSNGNYVSRSSMTDDQHGTLLIENAAGGRGISEKHKEEYARSIKDLVEQNWCGAEYGGQDPSHYLVFAGGGALLIEDYLRDFYPSALFPANPVTSQVRGLFKMGLQRSAKGCSYGAL